MKKEYIISEIEREILALSGKDQAGYINKMNESLIARVARFLFLKEQREFLNFLSVESIVVILKSFFSTELDASNMNTRQENEAAYFKEITRVSVFPKAWEEISKLSPVAWFQFVPMEFLVKTLKEKLETINFPVDYKRVAEEMYDGTELEFFVEHSGEKTRKDVKNLKLFNEFISILPRREDENYQWVLNLFLKISTSCKMEILYSDEITSEELKKLFAMCAREHYFVNDERTAPVSFGYLLCNMKKYDFFYKRYESDRFDREIDQAVEDMAKTWIHCLEEKSIVRSALILNFFEHFAYSDSHKEPIVTQLAVGTLKKLLPKCRWIQEHLLEDQRIALQKGGSVGAYDARAVINSREGDVVSKETAEKLTSMPIEDKLVLAAIL